MTYLRDATGKPLWSGGGERWRQPLQRGGQRFAPSQRDERHRQLGATWKTKHATGWNASVMLTDYKMLSDANRQADLAQPLADLGGAGTVTRRDGTGWNTLELQTTYTPRPTILAQAAMPWCLVCTATSTS